MLSDDLTVVTECHEHLMESVTCSQQLSKCNVTIICHPCRGSVLLRGWRLSSRTWNPI